MASSRGTAFGVSSSLAASAAEITGPISEHVWVVDAVWIVFREDLSEGLHALTGRRRPCGVTVVCASTIETCRERLRLLGSSRPAIGDSHGPARRIAQAHQAIRHDRGDG